jgi:hypothetical protein
LRHSAANDSSQPLPKIDELGAFDSGYIFDRESILIKFFKKLQNMLTDTKFSLIQSSSFLLKFDNDKRRMKFQECGKKRFAFYGCVFDKREIIELHCCEPSDRQLRWMCFVMRMRQMTFGIHTSKFLSILLSYLSLVVSV